MTPTPLTPTPLTVTLEALSRLHYASIVTVDRGDGE